MAKVSPIRPKIKIVKMPAPTGGWNARDSLADMPATDAVALINYMPRTTQVELRYGHSQHATGLDGQVETVSAYAGGATNKLFGWTSAGSIYQVTSAGAVGAADVTGLTNGRWQYINVATAANNYLMAVNGADKAKFYTGSAWATDGDGVPYNITVVDSATCININLFKNRVWLIKKGTLLAYYLPTGAIGGAAAVLDLRAFAQHGGSLVAMATWTVDAGYGVDDLAVFITNKGEYIVYRGTDPSSATTWALVGVWYLGSPVGTRCYTKYGGDALTISQDGVLPLSGALQSSRTNPRIALSDKIQQAVSEAVTNYGSNFGWQLLSFPKENMLILNVPVSAGSAQEQYVMNTITRAWGQFQGWTANCWELFNDDPYFGGNTFVGRAWYTNADNGSAIQGYCLQAFSDFGAPGLNKRATAMRPYVLTNGTPQIYSGINWDFNSANPTSPLSFTPTTYGQWDSGVWDSAIWGSDLAPSYALQGVTGSGHYGAPVFKSASSGIQVQLVSNDISLEIGNML